MYLTIDIGGTKTLLGRFTNDGELQATLKFPTPKEYRDFKIELAKNIAKFTTKPWALVCVAAPGRIDRDNGIVEGFGNLKWRNIPLARDVREITKVKVLLENDAKLAGLSEARLLKKPRHKVLYLTVGTGIGGAVVTNGSLDLDLLDSEPGLMLLENEGKLQKWESFASGKAIVKRFGKMAKDITDRHVWKLIAHDLAYGLIDVLATIQPDIVIIGGGVGSHFDRFGKFLKAELEDYETPLVPIPSVVGAKRPEEAVIYGCYELLKDYEHESR